MDDVVLVTVSLLLVLKQLFGADLVLVLIEGVERINDILRVEFVILHMLLENRIHLLHSISYQ